MAQSYQGIILCSVLLPSFWSTTMTSHFPQLGLNILPCSLCGFSLPALMSQLKCRPYREPPPNQPIFRYPLTKGLFFPSWYLSHILLKCYAYVFIACHCTVNSLRVGTLSVLLTTWYLADVKSYIIKEEYTNYPLCPEA